MTNRVVELNQRLEELENSYRELIINYERGNINSEIFNFEEDGFLMGIDIVRRQIEELEK